MGRWILAELVIKKWDVRETSGLVHPVPKVHYSSQCVSNCCPSGVTARCGALHELCEKGPILPFVLNLGHLI